MDRDNRDPLDIFRRGLPGGPDDAGAMSTGGFTIRDSVDLTALIAAQGKLVALFALLLERENILRASEVGRMLATIATVTEQENPGEGDILAIWAAGILDVAQEL